MVSGYGVRLVLLVDDYDRAIHFYCEQSQLFSLIANVSIGQGLRNVVMAYTNPRAPFVIVAFLATTPATLALVGKQASTYPLISLPVDDCLSEHDRLRTAGVLFEGDPVCLPYGCQATMIDPFGNKVCLSESYCA